MQRQERMGRESRPGGREPTDRAAPRVVRDATQQSSNIDGADATSAEQLLFRRRK